MLKNKQLAILPYIFSVLFGLVWLTYFLVKNTVPVDSGDGLMHYFIAQATWDNPIYFIHHWGKPVFSFLASPFAQFGINGIVCFNILVFLLTCVVGQKLLNKLETPIGLQCLFPLLLLVASDYSITVLGGLTEPLFNLLVMMAGLLLVNKKWVWFAIVLSFLPFSRSEGQLPLILGLILLIYNKQYKIIPFLGFGFIIYALVGWYLSDNFWWYFTESPYNMDNGIYGKGHWNHYIVHYHFYLSEYGLIITLIAPFLLTYFLLKRKLDFIQFELAFFAYAVFIGIVGLHSYFWATGQNGSLGLTRIATQGMPLFLLVNLSYIGRLNWAKNRKALLLFCVPAVLMIFTLIQTKKFPAKPNAIELNLAKAKDFLLPHLKKGKTVYYTFPYFAYLLDENMYRANDDNLGEYYFILDLNKSYQKGDFILWDSHFGPTEGGVPLALINQYKEFVLVKEFVFGTESIRIYQYVPVNEQGPTSNNDWMILPNQTVKIDGSDEFTNLLPVLLKDSLVRELEVVYYSSTEQVEIVFDNGQKLDYCTNNSKPTDSLILKFQLPVHGEAKLYIWNPRKVEATVSLKNCRIRQVKYPKVI